MRHFSTLSPRFPACSNLPLLRPTLSVSTSHSCSSSALTAFSACTLTAMPLASTNLTPFCSISNVLHTPASTQTNLYTNQLLHKHSFTPSSFLQKPTVTPSSFYTKPLFHKPPFTPTSSYRNELLHTHTHQLLRKPTFDQLLDKPHFTQTTFYTNQLYTIPALSLKARGPTECRRLLNSW